MLKCTYLRGDSFRIRRSWRARPFIQRWIFPFDHSASMRSKNLLVRDDGTSRPTSYNFFPLNAKTFNFTNAKIAFRRMAR